MMVSELTGPDRRHWDEAEGWLGLGLWAESLAEIEKITPENQNHPDVLCCQSRALMEAETWELAAVAAYILCNAVPDYPYAWIRLCYALYKSKQTETARKVLAGRISNFEGVILCRAW